jgi:hypothetical protein
MALKWGDAVTQVIGRRREEDESGHL